MIFNLPLNESVHLASQFYSPNILAGKARKTRFYESKRKTWLIVADYQTLKSCFWESRHQFLDDADVKQSF